MPDELDLRHHLDVIRRHAVLIILAALIAGGAAFAVSLRETPRYRATSVVLYTQQSSPLSTPEDPTRVLSTLANLSTNSVLMKQAAARLHTTEAALASSISVSASSTEDLIQFSATDTVPAKAAAKANALTNVFLTWRANGEKALAKAQLAALEKQLSDLGGSADVNTIQALKSQIASLQAQVAQPTSDLSLVQSASVPKQPYTPHTTRNFAIGLLSGLLLGLLAAFIRERADRRLRDVDEIERVFGRPALGLIPHVPSAVRDRRAAIGDFSGSSNLVESYRTVRTNLALFRVGFENSPLKTIVITSAMPGEGKSAVTANLAIALASSGRKVLAISADFRSPALHSYFDGAEGDGLLELLAGQTTLEDAARPVALNGQIYSQTGGGLSLLANSRRFFDPVVLFESSGMTGALEEIKKRFDVVLFDAPPLLAASDASVLTQHADGLLIVARLHSITREQVRRSARTLEAAEISPLGLIVTGIRDRDSAYGYGYEA